MTETTEQPTVQQVVESAYGWANGDLTSGVMLPPDALYTRKDILEGVGDRLLECMVSEASPLVEWYGKDVAPRPESFDHWAEAIRRLEQMQREVTSVVDALQQYAPEVVDG